MTRVQTVAAGPAPLAPRSLGRQQTDRAHVPFGVKLRNTQREQMSSALLPITDIGLDALRLRRLNVMKLSALAMNNVHV
jgi:hypothetical protein